MSEENLAPYSKRGKGLKTRCGAEKKASDAAVLVCMP